MNDVSHILVQLIDVAERTLCCRQHLTPADFAEFAQEVMAVQPPVGVMTSAAPRELVAALGYFWRSPEPQRPLWLVVIAALLQLVRNDLSQIIEARRQPLEPDTVNYSGARR
jgi:hypothetical protein